MFNINWLAWFLPYIDVELFPFWLDWLLRDSERYFFSQHKDESPNLPCGFLWLPKVSYGRATCRVHFPFLASRRVKAEAENVHKVYDTIANHWNHTSLLQTPCFFLGGGMGWGAQNWSMINVTLATPVPALGSLCFNDSSKSWCGGVESILRNLWDVDRGDRLDAIGLWKSEGSEIGLPCVWSMVSRVSDTELHPAVRIGFLEFLTPAAQLKRISSQSCFFCLEIIRDTSLWFPRVRFSRNEHSCGSTYLNKSTIPLLLLHSTGFPSLFNHWMIYFTVSGSKVLSSS